MPLHPDYEAMLKQLAEVGGPDLIEMPPPAAREMFRAMQPAPAALGEGVRNVSIPGPGGALGLRVYTPPGEGPFPIAMMFHGGGWVIGDLDTADTQSREVSQGTGAVVVSVDYRLAPEHRFPAAAEDCYAATCWAQENAASLHGDPDRLAVVGDSAGGNLAAVVALMARDRQGPAIAFQVLVYPVTDGVAFDTPSYRDNAEGYLLTTKAMRWFWDHYADAADRANPYASPARADDLSNLPAALVLTAEFDPLRDEGEAYAARLKAAGNRVECERLDGLIHGFFAQGAVVPAARPGMEKVCAALRTVFAA